MNKLPRPITARSIWHWVYFNSADSAMAGAIGAAMLGIVSRLSGLAGGWKKTKAGKTDFGGYSDSTRDIWLTQQKQHVRSLIMALPSPARALGNVLYLPPGEVSKTDLDEAHLYIFQECARSIEANYPTTKPGIKKSLYALSYCALTHYWDAISPAIEGDTPKTMNASARIIGEFMAARGTPIDTRNFYRDYRHIWTTIINEIRKLDDIALRPIDAWCSNFLTNERNNKE